ncbi:MAG: radical SAM protein [Candidatus Moranbacteria bacterium]|nr:radical SAM protein [Candidatus Moranbacteria bacterium]
MDISKPNLAIFSLTDNCNSKCTTCDYWKESNINELTVDEIKVLLKSLKKDINIKKIILTGGEPLFRADILEILREIRKNFSFNNTKILTNGILLQKYCKEIAKAFGHITVSIDGSNRATYCKIRGVDNFNNIKKGIGEVKRENPSVFFTGKFTIQKRNFREMSEIITVAKKINLDQISFAPVNAIDNYKFSRKGRIINQNEISNLVLNTREMLELEKIIDEFVIKNDKLFENRFILQKKTKFKNYILKKFKSCLNPSESFIPKCKTPFLSLFIGSKGSIRPCLHQKPMGNIREQKLKDILSSKQYIKVVKSVAKGKNKRCVNCEIASEFLQDRSNER